MKGSLFWDSIAYSFGFLVVFGVLIFATTIDFSHNSKKIPFTSVSAQWKILAVNKTMIVNISLENLGENGVVLEPELTYNKKLIKLENDVENIVLKPGQKKEVCLKFMALKGKFCNNGENQVLIIKYKDILNNKTIKININYHLKFS